MQHRTEIGTEKRTTGKLHIVHLNKVYNLTSIFNEVNVVCVSLSQSIK